MKVRLFCMLSLLPLTMLAQEDPFPFGQVTYKELETPAYEKDTTAAALIIQEFGHARIDNGNDHNLLFTYHVKVKILKKQGLEKADIVIPLYKRNGKAEILRYVKASAFNIENGSMAETKFNSKGIFTENFKSYDLKKFAIPNVKVGTVIEYEYETESPFFVMNFQPWEFQSDLPKLNSEYWAVIPANYRYNISLRGMLKLSRDESKILKDWFTPGGGMKADCVHYMWGMSDVPAFVEEDYMTSKNNFLSAIRFELIQLEYFDGRKDRVTKEWKDADQELKNHELFGTQLKKGKDVINAELALVINVETDPLVRAQKIFSYIRQWYRYNENESYYSEAGIKKAFEKKIGNVADINLSLVAALRTAGFDADPLILSTRRNGLLTDLYVVLSEFNYVIAKLDIDGKSYLLDATDDFLPFGVLPERCLNGRGRVISKKESYWFDIKPIDKARQVTAMNLQLNETGMISGSIQSTMLGYKAANKRSTIYSFGSLDEYIKDRRNKWTKGEITDISFLNLDDFSKPLVEKISIKMEVFENTMSGPLLFNPFILDRLSINPFRSSERLYPVDFGVPIEETTVINLELPESVQVIDLPSRVGLALPNSGGRYIFEIQQNGRMLTVNTALAINRTIFTSEEYHYLKELFNHVVNINRMDLILKRL